MKVLVFANGTPPSRARVQPFLHDSSLIVAADGGANALGQLGLSPDFVVGDLDSLSPDARGKFPRAQFVERADQNKTDLEKTLTFCLEKGATEIVVFGATGRRLDHELANLGILQHVSRQAQVTLVDDHFWVRVVRGSFSFPCKPGRLISLIALQLAEGVSVQGVQFPLQNARLDFGGRGVSNVATAEQVSIQIKKGELFLFVAHDVA